MDAVTPADDALRVRHLSKSYVEGVPVLDGVDLAVPYGLVTALVGANGSGKSTLVKILSGYHTADPGSLIEIQGAAVSDITPELLRAAGVRFVHQDPTIVGGISVLENLAVGGYDAPRGRVRWRAERARLRAMFTEWSLDVDPDEDAGTLGLATIAKLALLKALRRRPGDEPVHAIVLDEPTAALGQEDAAELLRWLRIMAERQNVGVLFISHRLEEVLGFADRVAVLRGGRIVAEEPTRALNQGDLVGHIVGAALDAYYPDRRDTVLRQEAFAVEGARGGGVRDFTVHVASGEVVGVTGMPGSGFEDVPMLLVDPGRADAGTLRIDGNAYALPVMTIAERAGRGVAFIPADRKRTALATDLTVQENIALPRLRQFRRRGWHWLTRERDDTQQLVNRFGITPASTSLAAGRLSGGNQQKVVLAKWLSTTPRVLVIHEPTQAVDVGAKAEIFNVIAEVARSGVATVIVSVEHEDLAHLCDRVLVFADGLVVAELSGDRLTATSLTAACLLGGIPGDAAAPRVDTGAAAAVRQY